MTQYSNAGVEALLREQPEVLDQLERATEQAVQQSAFGRQRTSEGIPSQWRRAPAARAAPHVVKHVRAVPVSTVQPIDRDDLDDAQINLHAFNMNLYGLFDNLAWAFVLHLDLLSAVGDRKKVGFFLFATKRFFPPALRGLADHAKMNTWHGEYLKDFRDALAHWIAPYIPPATYSNEDESEYIALEQQWLESIKMRDWNRAEGISRRQASLGSPCFVFAHSFTAERRRILYLHPQLIADAKTAAEVCSLFFQNWQQRAPDGRRHIP